MSTMISIAIISQAPIATIEPSDERLTEVPEVSPAAHLYATNLSPCIIYIFINPYMTTITAIAIIWFGTNSHNRTIRRKAD